MYMYMDVYGCIYIYIHYCFRWIGVGWVDHKGAVPCRSVACFFPSVRLFHPLSPRPSTGTPALNKQNKTKQTGSKMVGIFVLLTQFIHIVLMVDFFYYYIISVRSGLPMQLPRAGGLV